MPTLRSKAITLLQKLRRLEERFWSKVDKSGDCWEWMAGKSNNGYGYFSLRGKTVQAHRVSWELHSGEIPKGDGYHGTCVLHTCDNRGCVNPKHLFLGTAKDNTSDMVEKGRANGPKGERNSGNKLTETDIINIRKIYAWRLATQKTLGILFNVGQAQVSRIVHSKRWRHIET